jgi:hypothetical protein
MVESVEPEVEDKELEVKNNKADLTPQNMQAAEDILKVNPEDFVYDADDDIMKPKDLEAFDQMVEKHPTVDKLKRDNKREGKVPNLKKKFLDTLKVEERKKRDLSCDSVKSDCSGWGQGGVGSDREKSPGNRGETRHRLVRTIPWSQNSIYIKLRKYFNLKFNLY